jgi:sugar lactone lactonase YvrE
VAIPGAISCTGYTTADTTSADNGTLYNVVVYSPGGVVFGSGAVLTVTPAPAVPVITQDLVDVTAPEGGTATFSVVASANGPLFHYWTRIGAPTTPLGGSTFDIGPLQASDDGATVRVIVCNGPIADNRCTTSRDARLTVTAITLNAALLAGTPGTSGSADGTGAAARFNTANYVTANPTTGTIYIGDFGNSTIRTVTPGGVVSTLAGTPGSFAFADGTGSAARFNGNGGLALDAAGNLFVADWDNFLVRRVTAAGVVTTLAGSPGSAGSTDGTGAAARFVNPNGLAIDTAGNVYVADWGNATIRRITPAGVVTTLAGTPGSPGSADGTGAAARFSLPTGVAVDSAGNVYVADQGNNTIRRITPAGVVTTLAGSAGWHRQRRPLHIAVGIEHQPHGRSVRDCRRQWRDGAQDHCGGRGHHRGRRGRPGQCRRAGSQPALAQRPRGARYLEQPPVGDGGQRTARYHRAVAERCRRAPSTFRSQRCTTLCAPVEVLERVNNVPQPVDRVCAIAGGGEQLAMIRAINSAGNTTNCNAGSAKTVWFVGSLLGQG